MADVEHIVNFGKDRSSAFVGLSMAEVERNGVKLMEPIVRCRDCRYMISSEYCKMPGEEFTEAWFPVEPDGFCAWGKGDCA